MAPLISVGIPIYNNGATLKRAVESLLVQTVQPFDILISDNASSDTTEEVANLLVAQYRNVSYIRHSTSLGAPGNFAFLLGRATTPFFMWLAADDYISPNYLELALNCLQLRSEVTTCVTEVQFVCDESVLMIATGGDPLLGSPKDNLARYLNDPGANARMYGVHRTESLKRAFPKTKFHAFDWAAMAGTLVYGKHERIPSLLMFRDWTPPDSYVFQVRQDNKSSFGRLFPLAPMTFDLLSRQKIPISFGIIRSLLKINLGHHLKYVEIYHPLYTKVFGRLLKKIVFQLSRQIS